MIAIALFIGEPLTIASEGSGAWWDKPWETAFYKKPVHHEVALTDQGFVGDGQADRTVHGGVDKAICAYPAAHYPGWRHSLERPDFPFGAFGENLTLEGVTEADVCIGDVYGAGEVRLQITQPRQPCWKLARRWRIKDLTAQVERTGQTGWYFRVLNVGALRAPTDLTLLERPHPEWTIATANEIMHHKTDFAAARALAACPALSESWKNGLRRRADGAAIHPAARVLGPDAD